MNKVVSIEIASQVFWIEDKAYNSLTNYLEKIKAQLLEDECASEIYQDIELRIAELLFDLNCNKSKAVSEAQLASVIEQVGFIDSDEDTTTVIEPKTTKRSYRDTQNKILGGVCAGLSVRFGVPAFILRLVFLALGMLFGLGVALYLIFWLSLDTNTSRKSMLASQGKNQTAKQIASAELPKASPLGTLQRILFLPFSLIGALLSVFFGHFKKRQKGYEIIIKNLIGIALGFMTIFIFSGVYEFNENRIFNKFVSWVLSAAAIYLVILIVAIYVREFYLNRHGFTRVANTKIDKRLKHGAIIPVVLIFCANWYLSKQTDVYDTVSENKQFALTSKDVAINFDKSNSNAHFWRYVPVNIKVAPNLHDQIQLIVKYSGEGSDKKTANKNIQAIEYLYTFDDNTLNLNNYWTLKEGHPNRGQSVSLELIVPQDINVRFSHYLEAEQDEQDLKLYSYDVYHRNWYKPNANGYLYRSHGQYLHDVSDEHINKLSDNERKVLNDKFCAEFFIGERWSCRRNVQTSISRNPRFDKAFNADQAVIEQIREYLQPDRSLFVANLAEIETLIDKLTLDVSNSSQFQSYIDHLQWIKTNTHSN